MGTLIVVYTVSFFILECLRNSRRLQRIISRSYMSDLDDKLGQASWMFLMVGIVLTFTSSPAYLPIVVCVKMFASIFVDYINGRRAWMVNMGHIESAKRLMFPKDNTVAYNAPKLLNYGGSYESSCRH